MGDDLYTISFGLSVESNENGRLKVTGLQIGFKGKVVKRVRFDPCRGSLEDMARKLDNLAVIVRAIAERNY